MPPASVSAMAPASAVSVTEAMPTFDVFEQSFVIHDRYSEPYAITMHDLEAYVKLGISTAAIFAIQIGASAAVFIMLLILTKPEKRRSPVFILNSLALFFTILATTLQCVYWVSPWYNPYAYLTVDFYYVPTSAVVQSIFSTIFVLFVVICLEASLVLQVHIVCVTLPKIRRLAILALTICIAGATIICYIVQTGYRIKVNQIDRSSNGINETLTKARDILFATSLCFFSAIFCLKLGFSMAQRHRLGLRQFGPMQIIFIGGTQTMIIPVLFVILQFTYPTSRAASLVMSITAISLPLTSLWASASSTNSPHNSNTLRQAAPLGGNVFATPQVSAAAAAAAHSAGHDTDGARSGFGPRAVRTPLVMNESNITATERFSISSHKAAFKDGSSGAGEDDHGYAWVG